MADCIVLLHGWPGSRADFRLVLEALEARAPVLAPDLLGFGAAFTGPLAPSEVTADAHAARVLAVLDEAGHDRAVVAGYDIGSRIGQALARRAPERVAGLVATPAYDALIPHLAAADHQRHVWYQHLHRLPLAEALVDGRPDAVAAYLAHFWGTWSADPALAAPEVLAPLVRDYARPGAFAASVAWYVANARPAGGGPVTVPTTLLWGAEDPLFPPALAATAHESFARVEVRVLEGVGHFVPLEAPAAWVRAVEELLAR